MHQMRQHQRYHTQLQKISQTSSPSKQQQSPIETSSLRSRVNPSSLASSYLKFKRFQQEKQKKSFYQEESNKAQCESNYCHENQGAQLTRKTQTIEQKNNRISFLQESIVRKKMELTLLEDCFEKRSNSWRKDKFDSIFTGLLTNILKLCNKTKDGRKAYLNTVFKYGKERKTNPETAFKGLIEWVLKVVRQIFSVLSNLLKIPTSSNE